MKQITLITLLVLFVHTISAQETTKYRPHALWAPMYSVPETVTRSASGEPNTAYWQNKADYEINVTFDDNRNTITGTVTFDANNDGSHDKYDGDAQSCY